MLKAISPRRPRGLSWVVLAIVGLAVVAMATRRSSAQDAPPKGSSAGSSGSAKGDEKRKDDAETPEVAKKADVHAKESPESQDRYEDPRAEAALKNNFPEMTGSAASLSAADRAAIEAMAEGKGNVDLGAIDRYVRAYTAELTKRTNIKALEDIGAGNANAVKAMDLASSALIKPLVPEVTGRNTNFRNRYVGKLIEVFSKLWKANYFTRTFAMTVLSRSGDPQAMRVFSDQLNDPDQVLIVKQLAAVGILFSTQEGRKSVDSRDSIGGARRWRTSWNERPTPSG